MQGLVIEPAGAALCPCTNQKKNKKNPYKGEQQVYVLPATFDGVTKKLLIKVLQFLKLI